VAIAGAVTVTKDGTNPAYFNNFPQSYARLDRNRYDCAESASVLILDPDTVASAVGRNVAVRVFDPSGNLIDLESGLVFSGTGGNFSSVPVPIRMLSGVSGTAGNGILEGRSDYTVEVTYADPTFASRASIGTAALVCDPVSGGSGSSGQCAGRRCTN
jgi:hypothetical protein